MKVIRVSNVHNALLQALKLLAVEGIRSESRNGPVVLFDEPVTTVYERPAERVLFWPSRDANPFFHFMESLWMLAGRHDVEFPARFAANIRNYSDDGLTFHGAYGYRWRRHFQFDQLAEIIDALRADPTCRRQVLSMWDARADLGKKGKDLPCNLQALFSIVNGRLDMLATNRSNDMVWGCYGANAVHFSYLHEYMARSIGVPQGTYRQMSNNLHAYLDTLKQVEAITDGPGYPDPYRRPLECVEPYPLMADDNRKAWDSELEMFLADPTAIGFRVPFFRHVAVPLWLAHDAFKNGGLDRYALAREALARCHATDWRLAASEWIDRREAAAKARADAKARANDDGVIHG